MMKNQNTLLTLRLESTIYVKKLGKRKINGRYIPEEECLMINLINTCQEATITRFLKNILKKLDIEGQVSDMVKNWI